MRAQRGGVVQIHMIGNLRFLAHPSSYLRFEDNYGAVATSGFNLIVLISHCASWCEDRLIPATTSLPAIQFNTAEKTRSGITEKALSCMNLKAASPCSRSRGHFNLFGSDFSPLAA
jgi:hypothetical protein